MIPLKLFIINYSLLINKSPFWAFVRKEFYHIFRDKRSMMILLAMPVILIILFGYAITTEIKCVPIAVFDQSRDEVTGKIVEHLRSSEYFELYKMIGSEEEAQTLFRQGKVRLVVVFPPQYASTPDAEVQLLADATDPNEATQLTGYVTSVVLSAKAEIQGQLLQSQGNAGSMQAGITPVVHLLYNPLMKGAYNFVPGGDGVDPDPDLCHDDLGRYRKGKGDGDDGGAAGFSDEAGLHHSGQGSSLPVA